MRRLYLVAPVLLVACSREVPLPHPSTATSPVVYGDDDRVEWYAIRDADTKALARDAIVAMIDAEALIPNDSGGYDLRPTATLGAENGLCADQPFWSQPSASICSGALIDDRLVMTAGHCVTTLSDCSAYAWVFDYRYESDGVLAPLGTDSVYRCVDLVTNGFADVGDDYDFAIIELDRPVVGRKPAKVRTEGLVGEDELLTIMGFPNGIPLKVAANGKVIDPGDANDAAFVGAVDAFYGNSGSSVFGADGTVAGILVTGADDYVNDSGSCAVLQVLDEKDGEESMTYARHAVAELCEKGYPSKVLCGGTGDAVCGDGWCTDDETTTSCAEDCDGLFAVPATWSCDPGFYDAEDGCDCECGAYDPDCADASQQVFDCSPGSACLETGLCEVPIPAEWTCDKDEFATGGNCNCDCGLYDPDCDDPQARVSGCVRGTECNADGTCEFPIADGWFCSSRWYAQGDGCDCGCGAYDPDCDDEAQQVYGCVPGTECQQDGTCVEPVPDGWVCGSEFYADGDDCDCNCGVYDPDCGDAGNSVVNCDDGEGCDLDGRCTTEVVVVEPQPEPSPEPSPEVEPVAEPGPEPTVEAPVETTSTAEAETSTGKKDDDGCAGGGFDPSLALLGLALVRFRGRR